MMKTYWLKSAVFFMTMGLMASAAHPVWASSKKPRTPVEKYSATDDSGSSVENLDSGPKPAEVLPTAPSRVASNPPPTHQEVRKPTPASFDEVPENQIEPFVKRLALIKELLESYGRAYDYRTHTIRELETILRQLKTSRSQAHVQARPVATTATAPKAPQKTVAANPAADASAPDTSIGSLPAPAEFTPSEDSTEI